MIFSMRNDHARIFDLERWRHTRGHTPPAATTSQLQQDMRRLSHRLAAANGELAGAVGELWEAHRLVEVDPARATLALAQVYEQLGQTMLALDRAVRVFTGRNLAGMLAAAAGQQDEGPHPG